MALVDVIAKNKLRINRRLYIKRRLVSGDYETDWVRVDLKNGKDQVLSWGTISYGIDYNPSSDQASFDIGAVTLTLRNDAGYWNQENSPFSWFYPPFTYLNRKLARVKIEQGYVDSDDTEIGTATIFEGLIEEVTINEDTKANVKVMSYLYILKQVSISTLSYGAVSRSVSDIITDILSVPAISPYITAGTISPGNDIDITDVSELTGDCWKVLQNLALLSDSVPIIRYDNTLDFIPREPTMSSVFDFRGAGTSFPNIFNIADYDDEGASRVVLRWEEQSGTLSAETSNSLLALKYKQVPSSVNIGNVATGDKQSVLDALLARWEFPKPYISFTTKSMLTIVNILDRITLTIKGNYPENGPRWGIGVWGAGTWLTARGAILTNTEDPYMVTGIEHNLDEGVTQIHCEKINV